MLAQLCFQYAANRFGGEISKTMEGFIEILSNDLHDYYVNERNMSRYSGRLGKLLKINKEILENVRMYRSRGEVARVFDVFNLEFSHPEMFKDTGYQV
uniref:NR LBD domain-containing protein n=1 Tax=Caenorhabditis tropicalis TaxID=1561998 RepID=A0A1I7V233_9PELO